LADFVLCLAAKFTLGALPEHLFGQSQKLNSPKFAVAEGHATGILSPTGVGSVPGAMGGERCWIT
jgi:hypothetical protein